MSKISELSDGGSIQASDYLVAVRSGGNVKVRMDQINVDQVDLGDNEFIRLGNSQDLTLVHNASNSIINQAGIGDLLIQKAGSTKLTVNSTGIDVTGTATMDGLTVGDTSASQSLIQMLANPTNGANTIHFGDGTSADAYVGYINYAHDSNSMQFAAGGSTRATIDGATGNVGIGVVPSASSTTTNIELPYGATLSSRSNTTAPQFAMMSNAVGNWYEPTYKIDGFATQYAQQGNDGTHAWSTAASGTAGTAISFTLAMKLDASGNLLVGKTATALGTAGHTFGNDGYVYHTRNGNIMWLNTLATSASAITFMQNSGTVGTISVTTSATSYNTSSDQRLKDNIVDAPSASDDIDAIQVRSFDWKVDGSHQKYGMVAQELQTVAPEAVSVPEDPEEMMGVDYSKLVPMMLKEIQSLRARVSELESK